MQTSVSHHLITYSLKIVCTGCKYILNPHRRQFNTGNIATSTSQVPYVDDISNSWLLGQKLCCLQFVFFDLRKGSSQAATCRVSCFSDFRALMRRSAPYSCQNPLVIMQCCEIVTYQLLVYHYSLSRDYSIHSLEMRTHLQQRPNLFHQLRFGIVDICSSKPRAEVHQVSNLARQETHSHPLRFVERLPHLLFTHRWLTQITPSPSKLCDSMSRNCKLVVLLFPILDVSCNIPTD